MKLYATFLSLTLVAFQILNSSAQDCSLTPPTNLQASDVSSCSAILHWRSVDNASNYKVKYRQLPASNWSVLINVGTDTFYIFNNLSAKSKYEYAVKSICSNGTSSKFTSIKAATTLCSLPSSVSVTSLPSGKAKISVITNCNVSLLYYRYKTLTGNWVNSSALDADSLYMNNLSDNTQYIFQVSTCLDQSKWTANDTFLYQSCPNILLIVMDDSRFDTYGCNGGPAFFSSPNIDRIANEGINFKNNFVVYSYCSPGRGAIMTGLYPHKNGVENNSSNFFPGIQTVASILHDAGYNTALVGKYLAGKPQPGFDYWLEGQHEYNNTTFNYNGTSKTIPGHNTDILTDSALKFIRTAHRPFFIWLGYKATHTPITPQDNYAGIYSGDRMPLADNIERYQKNYPSCLYELQKDEHYLDSLALLDEWERYFETLKGVDDAIGLLLHEIDSLGVTDNTMIIFTSDNGHLFGEHGIYSKWLAYDPSIRVPIFIRYPAMFQYGTTLETDLTLNIDIAPTILEAAGIQSTFGMQGISLKDFANHTQQRKSFLYEYGFKGAALPYIRSVRDFNYKYILYGCDQQTEELFDLVNDPEENMNLVNDTASATTLDLYRNKLSALQNKFDDTIRAPIVACSLTNPQMMRFSFNDEDELSVSISPNPASQFLNIYLSSYEAVTVSVLNELGQSLMELQPEDDQVIDISSLPAGLYYLRATVGDRSISSPFVIER